MLVVGGRIRGRVAVIPLPTRDTLARRCLTGRMVVRMRLVTAPQMVQRPEASALDGAQHRHRNG